MADLELTSSLGCYIVNNTGKVVVLVYLLLNKKRILLKHREFFFIHGKWRFKTTQSQIQF